MLIILLLPAAACCLVLPAPCCCVLLPGVLTDGASSNGGFRYFWLTDSCPQTVRAINGASPFEVLSLADLIGSALQI
jgi:hypothetical protein